MIVSLIVAMGKNRVIGNDNKIPWKIPADMNFFKEVTMHHPVIMGRKTHESIGRALPNRDNIVITRQVGYHAQTNSATPAGISSGDCVVVPDLSAAIDEALKVEKQEIFIIGGAQVFEQAMPLADKLYITEIDAEFPGDTFFPEINKDEWDLLESKSLNNHLTGGYTIFFKTYLRKK